ncbi:ABC transporter ATP-binding protein [Bradyrhizobium sp. Ec3.3]|uniref:ABC transporter ATP-binding protein n=1 Tax=Bradyrhizobium sp. Ec3.3 TaxID=189753 RepID=UPI00042461D4|nr:ABC transporter ATP-binding protein [Bradyrhizobium sp. Ec3.3]
MTLLSVRELEVRHGLLRAVRGVSFDVAQGETVAFVGANGAGKTTLLRAIAGAHLPQAGRISFAGEDVTSAPSYRRARAGIALVPEGRRLFGELSVTENLLLGLSAGNRGAWNLDAVLEALPQLQPIRHALARNLSGGQQQAVAIGRALMTNPKLLLLDEISLGLSPVAVDLVYAAIAKLIAAGTTIILVEQKLDRAMSVADRMICMLEGSVVLEGKTSQLTRDQITDAYFGLGQVGAHS